MTCVQCDAGCFSDMHTECLRNVCRLFQKCRTDVRMVFKRVLQTRHVENETLQCHVRLF
jgi:hypothetical protein